MRLGFCAHVFAQLWKSGIIIFGALAFCLPFTSAQAQYTAPEGESGLTAKNLVRAEKQMAVTANGFATDTALATLRKGGSAVDAAIAAQMVLNLVEPQSSGIGGGGFLLHFDKSLGQVASYDGRETAPAAATENLFLGQDGKPMPKPVAMKSGISVGAPGILAMLKLAHEKHGKLPWADLFAPAIAMARDGFAVSPRLHALLAGGKGFTDEAKRYFYDADGKPWPVGHVLRSPALADVLTRIANEGPSAFYEGEIAADIAAAVKADARIPGTLTASDLASYRAVARDALCVPYRARQICGMGPPSSGGVAIAQTLKLIEAFDLGKTPLAVEPSHLMLEAQSLAFADRNRFLADPAFVPQPIDALLDDAYLNTRRALIDPKRSRAPFAAGSPAGIDEALYGKDATRDGGGTTHLSIADADGNAVALTSSIETAFGSGIMVRGFLLNNQLTDFSFAPRDADSLPIANRPEPGKRPRSSMSPTIVRNETGELEAVLGSPGGPAIIMFVAKAIVAHLDWGLDARASAALANFGALEKIALVEPEAASLAEALKAMGHDVRMVPLTSGLGIIFKSEDGLTGAADPRREGTAAGD